MKKINPWYGVGLMAFLMVALLVIGLADNQRSMARIHELRVTLEQCQAERDRMVLTNYELRSELVECQKTK